MKKEKRFVFRIDTKTLKLLRTLQDKTGNPKSVVIRNLIWQAVEQLNKKDQINQQNTD